jgi:hypothetical protein
MGTAETGFGRLILPGHLDKRKEKIMSANKQSMGMLENVNVNVKIKLAALWTSVMFLYAYADIQHFILQTGSLEEILGGTIEHLLDLSSRRCAGRE